MKKFVKIISVNILLIIVLIIFLEMGLFTAKYIEYFKYNNAIKKAENKLPEKLSLNGYMNHFIKIYGIIIKNKIEINSNTFRPTAIPAKINKNKTPIILMGCSFTYGDKLRNEDSFHSVLSNYTNRTVYNLAIGGKSPRTILYLLRHFDIINNVLNNQKDIEYIIYTYIPDHKKRLYISCLPNNNPKFKEVVINNTKHLEEIKNPSFLRNTFTGMKRTEIIYSKKLIKNPELGWNKFVLYMKEINNEIKNQFHYKDGETKFVIFVYMEDNDDNWEELEKEGIIVVKAKDILPVNIQDKEYTVEDGFHPSAKAWQVIVPALAKELNL